MAQTRWQGRLCSVWARLTWSRAHTAAPGQDRTWRPCSVDVCSPVRSGEFGVGFPVMPAEPPSCRWRAKKSYLARKIFLLLSRHDGVLPAAASRQDRCPAVTLIRRGHGNACFRSGFPVPPKFFPAILCREFDRKRQPCQRVMGMQWPQSGWICAISLYFPGEQGIRRRPVRARLPGPPASPCFHPFL